MRIVQLIDSLETGGAERMAVNYANALAHEIAFSGLVATRAEGPLKSQISHEVDYLYLNKKSTFDLKALKSLRRYIIDNKVDLIHAHSSSFLLAVLIKLTYPKVKIIWHDHYGNSEFLGKRNKSALQIGSFFFYRIITVNELLTDWASQHLFCKNVMYLPNFVLFGADDSTIQLQGEEGKRILCLANLRPQKNHFMLIEVAKRITAQFPGWTFHLIGKDFKDSYSESIHKKIVDEKLEGSVFVYGSSNAVASAIQQSDLGVLTSLSEGLPVSLLEYGYFGLPVVCTAVGEIPKVLNDRNGFLTESGDIVTFAEAVATLIEQHELRKLIGEQLKKDIHLNYTITAVIKKYMNFMQNGKH